MVAGIAGSLFYVVMALPFLSAMARWMLVHRVDYCGRYLFSVISILDIGVFMLVVVQPTIYVGFA